MQIVSDHERQLVDRYAKITLAAYIDGIRLDAGIGSCNYTADCGSDESFSFGNACAAGISLVAGKALPDIKGLPFRVTWAVDGTERPLMEGKIEDAEVSAGRTTIQAWDAMYYGGSDAFIPSSAMCSDCDAADAFREIAGFMGVSADPESLAMLQGITITGGLGGLPEDTTNAAVAGYIAGLVGGNAIISRTGQLSVKLYSHTGWKTEPYSGGASAQGVNFPITGVTLQREDTVAVSNPDGTTSEESRVYEFSAGDGVLMIDNPLADQAAADRAYEALEDTVLRPGAFSFPGGLLIEPGDIVEVESMDGVYSAAAAMISMSFDGGVKTEIRCGGAAPSGGAAGAINQALKALMVDFAKLRTLVAENARITNARISNLRAEDIVAGKIRSTDYQSLILEEVFPDSSAFPSAALFPNNGEEITRGIEIDFEAGVIRGVFYSTVTDELQQRLNGLEDRIAALEGVTQ